MKFRNEVRRTLFLLSMIVLSMIVTVTGLHGSFGLMTEALLFQMAAIAIYAIKKSKRSRL